MPGCRSRRVYVSGTVGMTGFSSGHELHGSPGRKHETTDNKQGPKLSPGRCFKPRSLINIPGIHERRPSSSWPSLWPDLCPENPSEGFLRSSRYVTKTSPGYLVSQMSDRFRSIIQSECSGSMSNTVAATLKGKLSLRSWNIVQRFLRSSQKHSSRSLQDLA